MFERFTDQARRVVLAAENEARTLGNNFVSTEHLLLWLLDEADGEGLAVLPASPRVSTVYQLALKEALRLGHDHVGTEHLLLGLACEGDGVAAQVLAACGADEKQLRRQVVAARRSRPA